jgi:O-antigen/teichoic acid export membrane protein
LGAIYPVLSKFYISSKDSFKIAYEILFKYLFTIAFTIGVGTMLLADKIILLIYDDEFIYSVIALRILIWWHVIGALCWLMGVVLQSINRQNIFAFSMGICAVFNVTLNLILIPIMSYIGASIATIATDVIAFLLLFYYVSKYCYKLPLMNIIIKAAIAGVIMGIIIYYIQSFNVLMVVLVACAIYFLALVALGGISKEDIMLIKGAIGYYKFQEAR